jgi:hypothetical protein
MDRLITRIHRMQSGITSIVNALSIVTLPRSYCSIYIVGCPTVSYNQKLYILCFSPNSIRMIESRRLRQEGHAACVGEKSIQGFGGET